jgi:hypothetical protein
MIDLYLTTCPDNKEKIRILDCGMTLMITYVNSVICFNPNHEMLSQRIRHAGILYIIFQE